MSQPTDLVSATDLLVSSLDAPPPLGEPAGPVHADGSADSHAPDGADEAGPQSSPIAAGDRNADRVGQPVGSGAPADAASPHAGGLADALAVTADDGTAAFAFAPMPAAGHSAPVDAIGLGPHPATGGFASDWPVAPDPDATPTIHKTTAEAAVQITRDNYHWGTTLGTSPGSISFGFRTSAPTYTVNGRDMVGTFSAFTAAEETAARAALALWSAVANITFTDNGDTNNATILFGNYSSTTDNSEAFAFFPQTNNQTAANWEGDVFMNTHYASTTNLDPGTYEFLTLVHEIGHALGLEHPGAYNAGPGQTITYDNNAEYVEDTRQYTVMSYFGEGNTGANFGSTYNLTPMIDDIAAIQRLYGANTTTRSGDTVYGFNSNAGAPYALGSATQPLVASIWDGGGNDTLDFSGYSQNQTINLDAESFSNVGGLVGNVSIAAGVTIENATGGSGDDVINGNAVANVLVGNGGNDTMNGGAGADTVYGGDGNDRIVDTDFITFDYYDGGAGIDTVDYSGIAFSDGLVTISLANNRASVAGGNTETLYNIENVEGSQGGEALIVGSSGANVLDGNGGDDTIDGFLGDDTLNGGAGTDTLSYALDRGVTVSLSVTTAQNTGGAGTDTVSGFENLTGSYFKDTLNGDGNDNVIRGGGGSDILRGGGGNDTLIAGAPTLWLTKAASVHNDTRTAAVSVDGVFSLQASDFIQDATTVPHATVLATANGGSEFYKFNANAGAAAVFDIDHTVGIDTYLKIYDSAGMLLASGDDGGNDPGSSTSLDTLLNFTFAAAGLYYVEVVAFPGSGPLPAGASYTLNISLQGAAVTPASGGSTLDGGAGDDQLIGGVGIDTASYASATSGVTVSLANPAAQNTGGAGIDTLSSIENLTGSAFGDVLTGNDGANSINGGRGVDSMSGLGGDDTYYVDQAGDLVFEAAGGGFDTVNTGISYALQAGQSIELLRLSTATGATALDLTGNELAQTIQGNAGANIIRGMGGGDVMQGYGGNDTYYVTSTADNVIEANGEGNDTIHSTVSYSLGGRYVETLILDGSSNINATGNSQANTLIGNSGANILKGMGGGDVLDGRGGNDTYYVVNAADNVKEAAGAGTDTIHSTVSYSLAGRYVEKFILDGSAAINATGNSQANIITGNAGANIIQGLGGDDTLSGGGGADQLFGGAGHDYLTGGTGADRFVFQALGDSTVAIAGRDVIKDFSQAQLDKIDVSGIDANTAVGGDQAFSFIGTGAFTHHAGELRYAVSGGSAVAYGDVNGDGTADFSVYVANITALVAGEFIL